MSGSSPVSFCVLGAGGWGAASMGLPYHQRQQFFIFYFFSWGDPQGKPGEQLGAGDRQANLELPKSACGEPTNKLTL